MVVKRQCSFCAAEIEPGTGSMFVKRDGTVFHFCTSSCRKQQLHLGRVGHRLKWTRAHALKRSAEQSSAEKASVATAAPPRARRRVRPTPGAAGSAPATPAAPAVEASTAAETPASPKPTAPKPRKPRPKTTPAHSSS
jgi:large subunit ribosomal protein L24e